MEQCNGNISIAIKLDFYLFCINLSISTDYKYKWVPYNVSIHLSCWTLEVSWNVAKHSTSLVTPIESRYFEPLFLLPQFPLPLRRTPAPQWGSAVPVHAAVPSEPLPHVGHDPPQFLRLPPELPCLEWQVAAPPAPTQQSPLSTPHPAGGKYTQQCLTHWLLGDVDEISGKLFSS